MSITYPLTGLKVMLADDDTFIRNVIRIMLNNLGVDEPILAADGIEGALRFNRSDVDLLITDIQMPKMNGLELIKEIRCGNTAAPRDLKIIAITSYSNPDILSSCLSLDVNGFLVKPLVPDDAARKIKAAMREKITLRPIESYLLVSTNLDELHLTPATAPDEKLDTKEPDSSNSESEKTASVELKPNEPHNIKQVKKITLVTIKELQPDMRLKEDIYAKNGVRLMSAGRIMNEVVINRLQELLPIMHTTKVKVNFE